MKIIKRSGEEVDFKIEKIKNAVKKASDATEEEKLTINEIETIANNVFQKLQSLQRECNVEEIQNFVEDEILNCGHYQIAKNYITYRYKRTLARRANTTDDAILSLIDCLNEEAKQENSNKNPTIASVQRDYMAGEVSKDISKRILLPKDVIEAHEKGLIHFHDMDYFSQHIHNCCLINLEDMLQNGTVISGTMIEKPHSFRAACNIATQIIAQVASSQYGGQSISLTHLAPFVQISREAIRKEVTEEFELMKEDDILKDADTQKAIEEIVEKRLRKEIKNGVQTIQYQVVTLLTTNGQAPFVTVFMYLNEAKNEQEKKDLAIIIEETLKQRIEGVKNEKGVWITPAFPKLIYVLEEDNVDKDSKYFYLTELAAKCTAKRLVPDYISEKVMLQLKGNVYTPMGCVAGNEVITYRYNNQVFTESFERMWAHLTKYFEIKRQPNNYDWYIETKGVEIYDQKVGFTNVYCVIKNHNSDWVRLKFSNGRILTCTKDHPFETVDGRIVEAANLKENDLIEIDKKSNFAITQNKNVNLRRAWLYGFLLCDSTYQNALLASIASTGEDEIQKEFIEIFEKEYGLTVKVINRKRGLKGNYTDLYVNADKNQVLLNLRNELIGAFGGIAKNSRHIPIEVFSWNTEAKLSFLAGMIDADGYLNTTGKKAIIQIGSVNKELAIQQLLLAQSCGFESKIFINHYDSRQKEKIRYRIEFVPNEQLLSFIKCKKKTDLKNCVLYSTNKSISDENTCYIKEIQNFVEDSFSYDVTTESEHFTVSGIYSHNCRSFLTPDRFTAAGVGNVAKAKNYVEGKKKYYGRFNQGVVTINLPDVALSANQVTLGESYNVVTDDELFSKNLEENFWKIFDERLDLCFKALMCRHNRLKGTSSDVAPILWQYGALARLNKGETIDKLLYDGYSTISLGYAGLYECTKCITGMSHTDENGGKQFALKVMQHMNDKCNEWKAATNIDFSIYGTPLESTTYKFAKCLQKRFGIIKGITDKNYITNSYHVHVTEEIDAFTKLKFESDFQALSPGGAISYVEVPNMQDNIPAVLQVMKFIYNNIMYAELNTKSDYCQCCGYDGEIKIVEKDNKLIWRCPNCGNEDQNKMNVARRTCGYIGTQFWNQGRTQEIQDRVLHL